MIFRVSEAETFRQWREDEEAELEALLVRLRGLDPPSQAMRAGTAFHAILERAAAGQVIDEAEQDGFRFIVEVDAELALSPIREYRAHRQYPGIAITGQLDVLDGLRVEDHKTTSQFDADRYLGGYQWRFYLDIFDAWVFRWNVFEMREVDPCVYLVHRLHRLEQRRYPGMERDCERLALDLADFARQHMPERLLEKAA